MLTGTKSSYYLQRKMMQSILWKAKTKIAKHTFPIWSVLTKVSNDYVTLKSYSSCCWSNLRKIKNHTHKRFMPSKKLI